MIDIQHSNERNFCGAITPKEKDKIMKENISQYWDS